jgi:hypothetical protein
LPDDYVLPIDGMTIMTGELNDDGTFKDDHEWGKLLIYLKNFG